MNWTPRLFLAAAICACVSMVACNQKKEENKGTSPAAAGATPGVTGGSGADGTSTVQTVVDGKTMAITVTGITSSKGSSTEGGITQIKLQLLVNGKTTSVSIDQAAGTLQTGYTDLPDAVLTYQTRCDQLANDVTSDSCAKFFFVGWLSSLGGSAQQAQIGVVKMFGAKLPDGTDQYSLSLTGAATKLVGAEGMIQFLNYQTFPL